MPKCYNRYIAHSLIVYVIIDWAQLTGSVFYAEIHSLPIHAWWNFTRSFLSRKRSAA
jgi:hypothetical protein